MLTWVMNMELWIYLFALLWFVFMSTETTLPACLGSSERHSDRTWAGLSHLRNKNDKIVVWGGIFLVLFWKST